MMWQATDCIIDLIQQFCITFFNNDIEIAAVKFVHDTLIVCFSHRSGSNRMKQKDFILGLIERELNDAVDAE